MSGRRGSVSMTRAPWYLRPFMSSTPRTRRRGLGLEVGRAGSIALLVALFSLGCSEGQVQDRAATIELGPCVAVEPSAGVADARCGVLRVEENRDAPNGRTIDLAIVVAPATSRAPAPDPVFFLAGGPGQGAAALAPRILHRLEPLRRDRDLVFVDVRGSGSSGASSASSSRPIVG